MLAVKPFVSKYWLNWNKKKNKKKSPPWMSLMEHQWLLHGIRFKSSFYVTKQNKIWNSNNIRKCSPVKVCFKKGFKRDHWLSWLDHHRQIVPQPWGPDYKCPPPFNLSQACGTDKRPLPPDLKVYCKGVRNVTGSRATKSLCSPRLIYSYH